MINILVFFLLIINTFFIIKWTWFKKNKFCCGTCGLEVYHPDDWVMPKLRHQCKENGNLIISLTTLDCMWDGRIKDSDPPPS